MTTTEHEQALEAHEQRVELEAEKADGLLLYCARELQAYGDFIGDITAEMPEPLIKDGDTAYAGEAYEICRENDLEGKKLVHIAQLAARFNEPGFHPSEMDPEDIEKTQRIIRMVRFYGIGTTDRRDRAIDTMSEMHNRDTAAKLELEGISQDMPFGESFPLFRPVLASQMTLAEFQDLEKMHDIENRAEIFVAIMSGYVPPSALKLFDGSQEINGPPRLGIQSTPDAFNPAKCKSKTKFDLIVDTDAERRRRLDEMASRVHIMHRLNQDMRFFDEPTTKQLIIDCTNIKSLAEAIENYPEFFKAETIAETLTAIDAFLAQEEHFIAQGIDVREVLEEAQGKLNNALKENLEALEALHAVGARYTRSKSELKNSAIASSVKDGLTRHISGNTIITEQMIKNIMNQFVTVFEDEYSEGIEDLFFDYALETVAVEDRTLSYDDTYVLQCIDWLKTNRIQVMQLMPSPFARSAKEIYEYMDTSLQAFANPTDNEQSGSQAPDDSETVQHEDIVEPHVAVEAEWQNNGQPDDTAKAEIDRDTQAKLAEAMRTSRLKREEAKKLSDQKEERELEIMYDLEHAEEANVKIHIERPSSDPAETWGAEVAQAEEDGEFNDAATKGENKRIHRLKELVDVWMQYENDDRYELSRGRLPKKAFGGSAPYWWVRIYDTETHRIVTALTCPYTGNGSYVVDSDTKAETRLLEDLANASRKKLREDEQSPAKQIIHHNEDDYQTYREIMLDEVAQRLQK